MSNYRKFNYTNNNYLILCTIKTYTRTASGLNWKNKPDEIEQNVYTAQNYTNYITAIPFFNNFGDGAYCRASYSYKTAGYLPTTVTTVSPYKEVKKIATFDFIKIDSLKNKAGWRESFIIDNAKYFDITTIDNIKYLKLITLNTDDKHSGVINLKNYTWVN